MSMSFIVSGLSRLTGVAALAFFGGGCRLDEDEFEDGVSLTRLASPEPEVLPTSGLSGGGRVALLLRFSSDLNFWKANDAIFLHLCTTSDCKNDY